MKRIALLATIVAATSLSLSAAPVDLVALKKYVTRAIPTCPVSDIKLERIESPGPQNFQVFLATQSSTDENCATRKYVLVSPSTEQVLIGQVFPLPADRRPAKDRIEEQVGQLLKKQVTVTIDRAPLPDGLKPITITRASNAGPFEYHGFIDAAERYIMITSRGNLRSDAGQTLLDTIHSSTGAKRGAGKAAKVTIVELSDLECPTCGRAHKELEPLIAKNLGRINYVRLDLPLFENHPWSLRAALGARAIQRVAPSKYWAYIDYVFQNQETVGKMDFDTFFKDYVQDHEIDWKAVEKIYHSESEKKALLDQVSSAFDNGINSTPTFIINGQQIGYANGGDYTLDLVKQAITGKPVPPKTAAKPAAPAKKK
jgi:protein-disulfide isomerase